MGIHYRVLMLEPLTEDGLTEKRGRGRDGWDIRSR